MRRTVSAGFITMMIVALTACGGGGGGTGTSGGSSDDATAAQAISEAIMKSQDGSGSAMLSVPQKDADCIGTGLVDKIGTTQLQDYGLLTKDLKTQDQLDSVKMSADDATSAADVLTGCTDMQAMMMDGMSQQLGTLPQKAQDCITKALSNEALNEVFVQVFQGNDTEAQKVLTKPMQECALQGVQ